jgi:hypothetical protein
MTWTVAGIDIGRFGIMCILREGNPEFHPLPYGKKDGELDCSVFVRSLDGVDIVYVEKPIGKNTSGMSVRYQDFGELRGLIRLHSRYIGIAPVTWKRHYGLSSDKQASIDLAKKLYPGVNLLKTQRSRVEDDNMAEALLLAHYGQSFEPSNILL